MGENVLKEEAPENLVIKQPVVLFIFLLDYFFFSMSKEELSAYQGHIKFGEEKTLISPNVDPAPKPTWLQRSQKKKQKPNLPMLPFSIILDEKSNAVVVAVGFRTPVGQGCF